VPRGFLATPGSPPSPLAREMIARALDAGVPAAWVAGDEVYGADSKLRTALQERAIGYVLAVACDHQITTGAGKHSAKTLARRLPARAWNRLSAGIGAKGHRWYDWALIDIPAGVAGGQALLVRRSISTVNSRSTAATHPRRCRWRLWSRWPDAGGRSRSLSKQVRD